MRYLVLIITIVISIPVFSEEKAIFSSIRKNNLKLLNRHVKSHKQLYSINSEGLSPLDLAIKLKKRRAIDIIWKKWDRPKILYPLEIPVKLTEKPGDKKNSVEISHPGEALLFSGETSKIKNILYLKVLSKSRKAGWIDSDRISIIKPDRKINLNLYGKWSYSKEKFTEGFIFRKNGTFSEAGPDGGEGRWKLQGNRLFLNYDYIIYSKKMKTKTRRRYQLRLTVTIMPEENGVKRMTLNEALFYKTE